MMEVQKRQRLETAERFQKHLERVVEMIQGCLASLPDDLPQMDGLGGAGDGLSSVGVGCSTGLVPKMNNEPIDVEEVTSSCMAAGDQEKSAASSKKQKIWDKDGAVCSIIDEIA